MQGRRAVGDVLATQGNCGGVDTGIANKRLFQLRSPRIRNDIEALGGLPRDVKIIDQVQHILGGKAHRKIADLAGLIAKISAQSNGRRRIQRVGFIVHPFHTPVHVQQGFAAGNRPRDEVIDTRRGAVGDGQRGREHRHQCRPGQRPMRAAAPGPVAAPITRAWPDPSAGLSLNLNTGASWHAAQNHRDHSP